MPTYVLCRLGHPSCALSYPSGSRPRAEPIEFAIALPLATHRSTSWLMSLLMDLYKWIKRTSVDGWLGSGLGGSNGKELERSRGIKTATAGYRTCWRWRIVVAGQLYRSCAEDGLGRNDQLMAQGDQEVVKE